MQFLFGVLWKKQQNTKESLRENDINWPETKPELHAVNNTVPSRSRIQIKQPQEQGQNVIKQPEQNQMKSKKKLDWNGI